MNRIRLALPVLALLIAGPVFGQDKSVRPGINDPFKDPDLKGFREKFEVESREVFAKRKEIVKACGLRPGIIVADVGAGTGLFTRLFASDLGDTSTVYAVDISQKFLDHIAVTATGLKLSNVKTVLCTDRSTELKPNSVDLIFVCDTYHHFEFPSRTLASMYSSLKPGGRLVVIDFKRIPGTSSDWILNHVRAGQEVVEREIAESGFQKVGEEKDLLKENYFIIYRKPKEKDGRP